MTKLFTKPMARRLLGPLLLIHAQATAQPPCRDFELDPSYSFKDLATGGAVFLGLPINDSHQWSTLEVDAFFAGQHTTTDLELPIHRAGSLQALTDGMFLLTGLEMTSWDPRSCRGHLMRLRIDTQPTLTATLEEDQILEGMDPASFYWNPQDQNLYTVDTLSGRLLVAPCPGPLVTLPQAHQFAVIRDASSLPILSEAASLVVSSNRGGPGIILDANSDELEYFEDYPIPYTITESNGLWIVMPRPSSNAPDGSWHVHEPGFLGHDDSIGISFTGTGSNLAFELIDLAAGTAILTGTAGSPNAWVWSRPPSVFWQHPGRKYQVRGGDRNASSAIIPLVRYGHGMSSGPLTSNPGILSTSRAQVGDPHFVIGSMLEIDPPPADTEPRTILSQAWIGVRDMVSGQDPVVDLGSGVHALVPSVILDLPQIEAKRSRQPIALHLPIAQDPELEGAILLFQFMITDQDAIVVSDVFGIEIASSNATRSSRAAGPSGSTPSARMEAAYRMLNAPGGRLNPIDLGRYARTISTILRQ